jgi:ABC transporter, permease protein
MRALFIKEFQELKRDRRTLAMIIMLPLLLLLVFGYAANFSVDHINVKVIGPQASSTVSYLKSLPGADKFNFVADTSAPATPTQAQKLLRSPSGDVVVIPKAKAGTLSQRVDVYLNGAKLFTAQSAKADLVQMQANDMRAQLKQLSSAATQAQQSAQGLRTNPTQAAQAAKEQSQKLQALAKQAQETNTNWIKVEFNPDLKTSWVMIPGLIGLVMAVIGTLITSIGMVREREAGTLEQLAVMPIKARSIIAGKISPYFMLAIVDMSAVALAGVYLFDIPFNGQLWLFALAGGLFLGVVLGLGVLISTVSQTTAQAVQMAIMTIIPQTLLSGLVFPLESMATWVRCIGYLLPLTWFVQVSRGVMLNGSNAAQLWLPLSIMALQCVLLFGAATARLARSLRSI